MVSNADDKSSKDGRLYLNQLNNGRPFLRDLDLDIAIWNCIWLVRVVYVIYFIIFSVIINSSGLVELSAKNAPCICLQIYVNI